MTTALQTITGALRILGVVGTGGVVDPDDSAVALMVMNEMLEAWSIDNLAIFTQVDQPFALVPAVSAYTVGASGTWSGFRPIQINQIRVTYQTIDYQVEDVDNFRFNAIPYKAQTGIIPLAFSYTATVPNGTVSLWPVPTLAMPIIITSDQQLTQIANLSTVLVFPPGYARAFRFNLAKELQSEFGAPMSQIALKIADTSYGAIKRANLYPVPAFFDPAFTAQNEMSGGSAGGIGLANLIAGNW